MILARVLRTSIGVPAERQIQEHCCLDVKFDQNITISVVGQQNTYFSKYTLIVNRLI